MVKTENVIVDQCGEIKIVGFNPKREQPAHMAALIRHSEVYGTAGRMIYVTALPCIIEKQEG